MIPFKVQLTNQRVRVVLYRRKSGAPFYARWHFGGKPYHRSTDAYVEAKARERARKLVEDVASPNIASEGLTVAKAVAMYLHDRWPEEDLKNRTYEDHKNRLAFFVASAGERDIGAMSIDQAIHLTQRFIGERKAAGNGSVTLGNFQRVLSRFFNWLVRTRDEDGRPLATWRANPAARFNLTIEKSDAVLKPPVPDDLIPKLVEHGRKAKIWPMIALCLGAGLRPIEAARMTWAKVNLDTRKLIALGKRREREIQISAWLLKELQALPRTEGGRLCPVANSSLADQMRMMRKAAGLPALVTLQACRRTACRRAAPHMNVEQYSHYFGHSIGIAKRHYIGFGLMGANVNVDKLNFDRHPDKQADKTEAENNRSIYE